MKPQYYLLTVIVVVLLITTACNDSSSGSGGTEMVTVSGKITAPDGETPIAGATVYTLGSSIPSGDNSNQDCSEPAEDYAAYICTNADGTFSFDTQINGNNGSLKVKKGAFSFTKTIDITGEQIEAGDIPMPADTKLETRIAVVTGLYGRMQDVLAKSGFGEVGTDPGVDTYGFLIRGTENFDLYDGDGSLGTEYPEYTVLFEDDDNDNQTDIHNYDIVFINSGTEEGPVAPDVSNKTAEQRRASYGTTKLTAKQNADLRSFVEGGGTLYATDWAYDYVEQTFPAYIDYLGSNETDATEAELNNVAQVGESGIEVDAEIQQPNLESWLRNVDCNNGESCLNSDNNVHITGFLTDWVVMDGPHDGADVKLWVEGSVNWSGGSGVRPLTVSFQAGEGTVIYSSFHTIEAEHNPEWSPQERLLQFLIFE